MKLEEEKALKKIKETESKVNIVSLRKANAKVKDAEEKAAEQENQKRTSHYVKKEIEKLENKIATRLYDDKRESARRLKRERRICRRRRKADELLTKGGSQAARAGAAG